MKQMHCFKNMNVTKNLHGQTSFVYIANMKALQQTVLYVLLL